MAAEITMPCLRPTPEERAADKPAKGAEAFPVEAKPVCRSPADETAGVQTEKVPAAIGRRAHAAPAIFNGRMLL